MIFLIILAFSKSKYFLVMSDIEDAVYANQGFNSSVIWNLFSSGTWVCTGTLCKFFLFIVF